VTSLLSLTALRLRDKNVLIKRTDIIENLGNATIIASDKTGTLTQNRMTVENVWCNQELHKAASFQAPPSAPQVGARERGSGRSRVHLYVVATCVRWIGGRLSLPFVLGILQLPKQKRTSPSRSSLTLACIAALCCADTCCVPYTG
jgi:magnesium-transporting ATPase (P-type)